jgi:hypothetical protein
VLIRDRWISITTVRGHYGKDLNPRGLKIDFTPVNYGRRFEFEVKGMMKIRNEAFDR